MRFKFRLQSPWCKVVLLTVLLSGVALNGIAWMQARAMTHYVEDGERTAKPEELSLAEKAWIVLTGVRVPQNGNSRYSNFCKGSTTQHSL